MTTSSPSRADDTLRWIGDLDHPFYQDERQRYVWYESAAIGFQLTIVLQYIGAGLAMVVGGADALPYLVPILAPSVIAALVVQWYSRRHHAPYSITRNDLRRSRGKVLLLIAALYLAGAVRVAFDLTDRDAPTGKGFAIGLVPGVGAAVGVLWAMSKRDRATERADHQDDA